MRESRTWYAVGLFLILLLAAGLRFVSLDAGWFGVDQARDIAWAESIAAGEGIPPAGPAMRNRVRLGATYYVFWAIPALVSDSVLALYGFAALLGVLSVAGAAALGARIGGARAGLFAAAWLATSPVAVIDSRIAWAPAAVPAAAALFYLLARKARADSSPWWFALLFAVASFATQLHLAAVSLGLVALLLLLRQRPGRLRVAAAVAGGTVPLVPMLLASAVALPSEGRTTSFPGDAGSARWLDLLLHPGRLLEGLSPPPGGRPALVDAWFSFETMSFLLPLAAIAWVLRRGVWRQADEQELYAPTAGFLLGLLLVLLLPADAWYYYLDVTLVPAAVLFGVAAAALPARALVGLAMVALLLVRAGGLAWWVDEADRRGIVAVNLEWMRLGGAVRGDARARVPTVATHRAAWEILGAEWGIPASRSPVAVHGVGFEDLSGDNGFFARRLATGVPDAGASAVILHREDPHPAWSDGLAEAHAGPFVLLRYQPRVDLHGARVRGCGARSRVPRPSLAAPRDYGSGERRRAEWGCPVAHVEIPVPAAAAGTRTLLVARVAGAGRVADFRAEPAVERVAAALPGGGIVLRLPEAATWLELELALDGPAELDVYEIEEPVAVGDPAHP